MKEASLGVIRELKNTDFGSRNIQRAIFELTGRVKTETTRLTQCIKTRTFRLRKASTVAALPQLAVESGAGLCRSSYWFDEMDKIAGKCIRSRLSLRWLDDNSLLCAGFSPVSFKVIRSIIAEIQESGFITLKNAMLQCGPMYTTYHHRRALITFLLKYFPILSYHINLFYF